MNFASFAGKLILSKKMRKQFSIQAVQIRGIRRKNAPFPTYYEIIKTLRKLKKHRLFCVVHVVSVTVFVSVTVYSAFLANLSNT